jgi:hypothetical protein
MMTADALQCEVEAILDKRGKSARAVNRVLFVNPVPRKNDARANRRADPVEGFVLFLREGLRDVPKCSPARESVDDPIAG